MKACVLISIVAAGRQARDTQLLFDRMMNNNNVQEKTFFSETDSILLELQFYLQSSGLVQDWIPMIIYRWNKDWSIWRIWDRQILNLKRPRSGNSQQSTWLRLLVPIEKFWSWWNRKRARSSRRCVGLGLQGVASMQKMHLCGFQVVWSQRYWLRSWLRHFKPANQLRI